MRPAISCPGSATPATGSSAPNNGLPRRVEQFADNCRAVDLARVGVNPAVVHRILGDLFELFRLDPDIAQPGGQAEPAISSATTSAAGSSGRPRASLTRICFSRFTASLK